jgi:hypothetical protein
MQFHRKALSSRSQRRDPAILLNIRQYLRDGGIKFFHGWPAFGSAVIKKNAARRGMGLVGLLSQDL